MVYFMIYGCTGYTGRLVASYAKSLNLNFIIAGRKEDKTRALATNLDVQYRFFNINEPNLIDEYLEGARLLLNCAGPFVYTARPLMESCIRVGARQLLFGP